MGKRGEKTRVEIMAILRRSSRPLSAYDFLAELRHTNPKIGPPTVYRALATLGDQGRVHRIESLNAYVACECAPHECDTILTICNDCGGVEENVSPELLNQLSNIIDKPRFAPTRHVIEIHGVCASCDDGRAPA